MPSFSRNLEKALHQSLAFANERRQEYATLEHLLLALIEDRDASEVMIGCFVDMETLRRRLFEYIDTELDSLVLEDNEEAKPTAGFQRVIRRAVINVQSAGKEEVTGVEVLVAIFEEKESHAVYFLHEQDMNRYDAVNYMTKDVRRRADISRLRAGIDPVIASGLEARSSAEEPTRGPSSPRREAGMVSEKSKRTVKQKIVRRSKVHKKGVEVFISYSHFDVAIADNIYGSLVRHGLDVWWDKKLKPGERWRESISSNLDSAKVILVLWTKNSVTSDGVIEEASLAQKQRKLIHVRLDDSILPYGFGETQYIDLKDAKFEDTDSAFMQLIEAIELKLKPPSREEMLNRIQRSSNIQADTEGGVIVPKDRCVFELPEVQDKDEFGRRVVALQNLVDNTIVMIKDREHFQVSPCAIHSLESIRSVVKNEVLTWYCLDDGADILRFCISDSDAEGSWNGTIFKSAQKILERIESLRIFLEPRQLSGSLSEKPLPPLSTVPAESAVEIDKLARETQTIMNNSDLVDVVGQAMGDAINRVVLQAHGTVGIADEDLQSSRARQVLVKLAFVVGAVITATAGGVATNLLTVPSAAAILNANLQPILDRILSFFY